MSPDILNYFSKYIQNELGIIYAEHNLFQLQNRLEEIAKLLGHNDINSLYAEAQKGITGQFKQLLLDLSTNNETSFFRDGKVFNAIEQTILKPIIEKGIKPDCLKVWSAASSSGQEPLTIAMLIQEFAEKNGISIPYSITGTDISDRILEKAKSGTYSQLEIQRGLPAKLLVKYFSKDPQDNWKANNQILNKISYSKQNLKSPFHFPQKFHLILCRNVLIYQNVEGKTDIINRMKLLLEPGGILVLGSGESLFGLSNDFDQEFVEGTVIYRLKSNLKAA